MYQDHFKFERMPFEQLPDPNFLYITKQHDEALTRMRFALAVNDSFAVITGEVGSGKTTLVRKMLADLAIDCTLAFITHTRLSDVELLQSILVEFGLRPFDMGKIEMLTELRKFIDQQHVDGKRVIIIVDEAQNLGIDVLEELRLLTCLDSTEEKALNIVLIGQPQLSKLLESPELEQLRQRCRMRFHLHRLSDEQTRAYIKHRIAVALGKDDAIFDAEAETIVFERTRGVPRLINTLCDTSLMMACMSESKTVSGDFVNEAVTELGWSFASHAVDKSGDDGNEDNTADSTATTTARLTLKKSAKVVAEYDLNQSSHIIGRAYDCDINVDSRYFSRHHAIISKDKVGWSISDLNSTNGIYVNGSAIPVRQLEDGDVIEVGAHQLIFQLFDNSDSQSVTAAEEIFFGGGDAAAGTE